MDINLLAKIVGDLVLDHDEVGLPGLGTFVAEMVPASFSDKGFTINPPYRRLSFHQGRSEDNLLADSYAASNSITREQAVAILTPFLEGLKSELKAKKAVALPGLGRLRATRENNFFFVSDEDLDIFPDGFALRPVSLKSHVETPEETRKAVDALAAELRAPEPAGREEPAPGAVQPEPVAEPVEVETTVPEKRESRKGRVLLWVAIYIVLLALAFFAIFMILVPLAPEFVDKLLYTSEQLEIINM